MKFNLLALPCWGGLGGEKLNSRSFVKKSCFYFPLTQPFGEGLDQQHSPTVIWLKLIRNQEKFCWGQYLKIAETN